MTNVMVLDAGNSIIKAKTASRELQFPHGLKLLTETEWNSATRGSAVPPDDYVLVNGLPYVVGSRAERYGLKRGTFQTGAARYVETYYGVFVAVALARIYERNVRNVFLFASHSPHDAQYREDLVRAALQDWTVETGGKTYKFSVRAADTFDEPNGGVSNLMFTSDGMRLQNPALKDGTSLVIDIGGHTTDFLVVYPGGEVDIMSARSLPEAGINQVLDALEGELRTEHKTLFKKQNVFNPAKLREALRTGYYDAGGRGKLDCNGMADRASYGLLNDVANMYQRFGGPTEFNYIVLTGGGGGAMEKRLQPVLDHPNVMLADSPDEIEYANVRGGMKLFRMYESQGWV